MPLYPAISVLAATNGIGISTTNNTISFTGYNATNVEPIAPVTLTSYAPSIGSWYFDPFYLDAAVSGGRINRLLSFETASTASILLATSANFATGTTGSRSVSLTFQNTVAMYSLGAGTNSTRLESFWSNTFSVGIAQSVSVSSAAAVLKATHGATISYIASIDSAGRYTTTSTATSQTASTTATSLGSTGITSGFTTMQALLSGRMIVPVGINTTLQPGNFWMAQAFSSASTTAGTSMPVWALQSQFAVPNIVQTSFRMWGTTATQASSQFYPGAGAFTTTSAAPPSTVAFTDIRSFGTALRQYFNIVNSNITV